MTTSNQARKTTGGSPSSTRAWGEAPHAEARSLWTVGEERAASEEMVLSLEQDSQVLGVLKVDDHLVPGLALCLLCVVRGAPTDTATRHLVNEAICLVHRVDLRTLGRGIFDVEDPILVRQVGSRTSVLLSRDPCIPALVEAAGALFAEGPSPIGAASIYSVRQRWGRRLSRLDRLWEAGDRPALYHALSAWYQLVLADVFRLNRGWYPGAEAVLQILARGNRYLYDRCVAFLEATDLDARVAALARLIETVLLPHGGPVLAEAEVALRPPGDAYVFFGHEQPFLGDGGAAARNEVDLEEELRAELEAEAEAEAETEAGANANAGAGDHEA